MDRIYEDVKREGLGMENVVSAMMDGLIVGSELAKLFGLHTSYFAHVRDSESLNKNINILKFKHVILVEVPMEAKEYIRDYTATALSIGDDETPYEYILNITNKTKIGFWK